MAMGAIWYQFDWTLLKKLHKRDVEIAQFSFSSETFWNLYRSLFSESKCIPPRQKKESCRRGGGGVLMLNKLPSQAFFFFQIESVHDGYFLGS